MFWTKQIGHTPMIGLPCRGAVLFGKLEGANPAGSVKDRAAFAMLADARERGLLAPGGRILEATSGNTGIALASLAAAQGYGCRIFMPENMSRERSRLMKAYGAEVILTPAGEGMAGAVAAAIAMAEQDLDSFYVNQFHNPANPKAHFDTTGPEIWADTGGNVDIFVAGVGTGGTVTGVGRFLKAHDPRIRIAAVEPRQGDAIAGIGPGFLPSVLDRRIIDEWIAVSAQQAVAAAKGLAGQGILVGISAGAALHAAEILADRPENRGKTIVALLPDSGERYLSTGIWD